jgi:hypothetical protein
VRATVPEAPLDVVAAIKTDEVENTRRWRRATIVLASAFVMLAFWSAYSATLLFRSRQNQAGSPLWTPELEQLWRPFLVSKQPLIVAIADPLFIGLQGTDIYFRKISLRRPEDAANSPEVSALRKLLGNPTIQPTFNFAPTGELISSFLIGKLLGTRRQDISLARSSQVPLQELAENNVILIGPEVVFSQKLPGMQLQPELAQVPEGIRNLHPRPGEPALFMDSTWGREGAIQAFTDPALARTLVNRLRKTSGEIPHYYQIVVRVKFTDGIPTDIAYVLHRDLTPL